MKKWTNQIKRKNNNKNIQEKNTSKGSLIKRRLKTGVGEGNDGDRSFAVYGELNHRVVRQETSETLEGRSATFMVHGSGFVSILFIFIFFFFLSFF